LTQRNEVLCSILSIFTISSAIFCSFHPLFF
jgi:hypothetical protein